jgi:hypothetical protein
MRFLLFVAFFPSLLVLAPPTIVQAAEPLPVQETYLCRRANGPIVVDGKADDASWTAAATLDKFYTSWRKQTRGQTPTAARLLWDDENLYFFADMVDADLYADATEHDAFTWHNDVFELFFKPSTERRGYYEFQVTPRNVHFDMFVPARGAGGVNRFAKADPIDWETRTVLRGTLDNYRDRDGGWSVEGRIPWKNFVTLSNDRPTAGAEWKFTLCRYDYSVDYESPELTATAPLSRADFHLYEDYGTIRFVDSK